MSLFGGPPAGLGLSEADNVTNDFLRALSQPLLIQTPLQVRVNRNITRLIVLVPVLCRSS